MQPEGQVMTWEAFKTKFCKAHIPSGLIKIMRDKFLNLKQGGMSVPEYLDKFTTWGRYAPNDIDTDEKKRERFLNRLQEELQTYLVAVHYPDLEAMVDAAIMVEDKNKAARKSHKRRMMSPGGPSGQRSRSLPPSRVRHLRRGLPLKPPGPITQTVNTPATALQAGISLEATTTPSTPLNTAKAADVTPVASWDTSLRSAL
jgi:hypothetical protein